MQQDSAPTATRRRLLLGAAAILFTASPLGAMARVISGALPWQPGEAGPPRPVRVGPWQFFTPLEAEMVDAAVARLIPQDDLGPGGKEAGCTTFIDYQLAGYFGGYERLYMQPPFIAGTPQQGLQSPTTPAQHYRAGLAALDRHCRSSFGGKAFAALTAEQQDDILHGLDSGKLKLENADGKRFFELLLQNAMEGFFADPIYGGNRGMVSWRLLGFPGARYDFRDHVGKHNQPYPLPPVSIMGRSDWNQEAR